ncbi:MAG: AMP-binding protein [Balneolaceae bacterium]
MIYDWARIQAELHPETIAVTSEEGHLSYASLESESNKLAGLLLKFGLQKGDRVGLLLANSPENIIATHGISKAGGIAVPVDIANPENRIAHVLSASDVSFMVIDQQGISKYRNLIQQNKNLDSAPWIWWSTQICGLNDQRSPAFSKQDVSHQPDYPFQKVRDENFPAYIYFESGEGNYPKGITFTHKNIASIVEWALEYFQPKPADRITGFAQLSAALSVFDVYTTFAAGSHLYLAPVQNEINPLQHYNFILENDITQWFADTSMLTYLARFDLLEHQGLPGLKRLLWHGKNLQMSSLNYWLKQLPKTSFTNLYGPNQTILAGHYSIPETLKPGMEIPIGKPCTGQKLHVLNSEFKPVPTGFIGDLYVSGEALSKGYWKDEKSSKIAFKWFLNENKEWERVVYTGDLASCNVDGIFYYHGWADYKVKKKTNRTDLKEIEAALGSLKNLKEFAVVPVSVKGEKVFGCAYVSEQDFLVIPPALKNQLSKTVPGHMLPNFWKSFTKLPRKKNGKIDRKQLSKEFSE